MATKCIVIGEDEIVLCDPRPIEFCKALSMDGSIQKAKTAPHMWQNIELITRENAEGYDLMFAYNGYRGSNVGSLFLGHWNDGIV